MYSFQKNIAREQNGSSIAEFGPVLFILFIVVALPLISLFSLAEGAATLWFAATTGARAASSAPTFSIAQTDATNAVQQIVDGPLGTFAHLTPERARSLLTLKVKQINIKTQSVSDAIVPANTDLFVYEYEITLNYNITPIFVPVFIPGRTIPFSFTVDSTVEHPEGLGN